MAVNGKQIGNGSIFSAQFSTTGGSTWYPVAHIISIGGPDSAGNDIELATLSSTSNFIDFCRGDVDGGEVTLSLAFSSTTSAKQMGTAHTDGVTRNWKVTPPTTASAEEFNGYIKSMGRSIERNEMITRPVTIKVTGDPGIAST